MDDIRFVLTLHYNRINDDWTGTLSRDSIRTQKRAILELFAYQDWSPSLAPEINFKLFELIRYFPKGRNALRQLILYLNRQHIIIPSYRTFQDMFSAAFSAEESAQHQKY